MEMKPAKKARDPGGRRLCASAASCTARPMGPNIPATGIASLKNARRRIAKLRAKMPIVPISMLMEKDCVRFEYALKRESPLPPDDEGFIRKAGRQRGFPERLRQPSG